MTDDQADDPEPAGPFYANFGPVGGVVMYGEAPVQGVLADPSGTGGPVGVAWLNGSIPSRRGPVQVWRLTVDKRDLEGRWICRCRRFERLGDAAEDL